MAYKIKISSSKRRYNKRNYRDNNTRLSAFIKADNTMTQEFTSVKHRGRRQHKKSLMSKVTITPTKKSVVNRFNCLEETEETTIRVHDGPKVVKPKKPTGVWGKPRVKFSNDNVETLMKPQPTKVKEFYKNDAPIDIGKIQQYPAEEEYLKLKRSKNAWKPKVRNSTTSHEDALKQLIEAQKNAPMVNWGDAVSSSDEESDDDEEEILLDSFGRPNTDNSAW